MTEAILIGTSLFNLIILAAFYAKLCDLHKELQKQSAHLKSLDDISVMSDYRQRRKPQSDLPEQES